MKIIIPGHRYELDYFEDPSRPGQVIQFIQKEPITDQSPPVAFKTIADGTTNEEVLRMLIDRMFAMHQKLPSKATACAITHCEEALHWLNARTAERKARGVEGTPKP